MTLETFILSAIKGAELDQLHEIMEFWDLHKCNGLDDLDDLRVFASWELDEMLDAEHSKGQWILDIDDSFPLLRRGWRCSECGRRQTYGTTPYCPYCGKKMEVKR